MNIKIFNGKNLFQHKSYTTYIAGTVFAADATSSALVVAKIEMFQNIGMQLKTHSSFKELRNKKAKQKNAYPNPYQLTIETPSGSQRVIFDVYEEIDEAWILNIFKKQKKGAQKRDIDEAFRLQEKLRCLK